MTEIKEVSSWPRVDNFNSFPREFKQWEFYFVQVIERYKDNPEKFWLNWGNSCRVLKSYTISSEPELNKRIPLLKEYCQKYKARCYIHHTRRDQRSVAYDMIIMLWEFLKKNNHNLSRLFDSACGHNIWVKRQWLIDVDTKDEIEIHNIVNKIKQRSNEVKPWLKLFILWTLNWVHIITDPFDLRILDWKYDIHKNNPTLLYFY